MYKLALCIKRSDLHLVFPYIPSQYNPNDAPTRIIRSYDYNKLLSLKTQIIDRKECETMPEYLQLIPYITLMHSHTEKFFIYTRGELGNESRLHGMCSLGIGGHIEEYTSDTEDIYNLENTIIDSALRELKEEVGLELALDEYQDFKNSWREHSKIIYDDSNTVGSVHIGLHMTISVHPNRITNLEHGVITRGRWLSLRELKAAISNGDIQLESWSDLVYQSLTPKVKNSVIELV